MNTHDNRFNATFRCYVQQVRAKFKKKRKSELEHTNLQNEILRTSVGWQLKLLPCLMRFYSIPTKPFQILSCWIIF